MTRAEMADHSRKVAWVGPYHASMDDTEVLVMADDAYTAILRHNTIASAACTGEKGWSTLVEQFGRDQVKKVLDPVIRDVQHLLEEEEDADDSDTTMQKCLDLREHAEWAYAYQPLDDADVILVDLPEAVVELRRQGGGSPMTEYSPCSWDAADLPRIKEILTEAGWEVHPTDFHPAWP